LTIKKNKEFLLAVGRQEQIILMKPFHSIVNKLKWTNENLGDYIVGYFDRIENKILEMPLPDFLASDIPEHRAQYIKKNNKTIWDRGQ